MRGTSTPDWRRVATSPQSEWLTEAETCNRIPGMTLETLARLRESRNGPRWYRADLRTILYSQYEIDTWMDEMRAELEAARA